jgi:XTP/dITP diphosphohydrolase
VIVYCATTNPGKLREFRMAAPDFDIRTVSVSAPEEHGQTFEENACAKALYYGALVDGYLFADDSGIEVMALGGEPGVDSARFDNVWLLDQMCGVEDRAARFVCVIALVRAGALVGTFRGSVEGTIVVGTTEDAPRGSNGFGYDPLFYYAPLGCTFGEATTEQKMRVSHRAQALGAMFTYLRSEKRQLLS